jgi:hypothetical protein
MNFLIYLTLIANAFIQVFASDQKCLDSVKNKALVHITTNNIVFDDSCRNILKSSLNIIIEDNGVDPPGTDDNGVDPAGTDDKGGLNRVGTDDTSLRAIKRAVDDNGNHSGLDDNGNHSGLDDNGNHSGLDDNGNHNGLDDNGKCLALTDICNQILLDNSCDTTTYNDCINSINTLQNSPKSYAEPMLKTSLPFLMLFTFLI